MKKTVFFDIYGTLIDIRTDEYDPSVYSVLSRYLSYHSVKIPPDELKNVYFDLVEQHLRERGEAYPEVDVYEVFHEIMHKYGSRRYTKGIISDVSMLFRSLTIRNFCVFPGLYEAVVSVCEKYKTAIISDAQWVFTEPEVSVLGLDQFFQTRVLSSRHGFKKPDVRMFEIAMEKLRIGPEESVYIGDNPSKDLVGAKKAGMKCILFRPKTIECEGFRADGYFHNYSELEKILFDML